MNNKAFQLYVDFLNDKTVKTNIHSGTADSIVAKHFQGMKGPKKSKQAKAERQMYRSSEAFLRELKEAMKPCLLTYEQALNDETIVEAYKRVAADAEILAEGGVKKVDFDHLEQEMLRFKLSKYSLDYFRTYRLNAVADQGEKDLEKHFKSEQIVFVEDGRWEYWDSFHFNDRFAPYDEELDYDNAEAFLDEINRNLAAYISFALDSENTGDYVQNTLLLVDKEFSDLIDECNAKGLEDEVCDLTTNDLFDLHYYFVEELESRFPISRIVDLIAMNPRYHGVMENIGIENQNKIDIFDNIVKTMPESLENLYPATRQMHRKFILHIGPTNSGKTYEAMQEMRKIGSGIYLAPLRLLAYEQYEKMNADGFPCSMITGEETLVVDGALFTTSTIEMMNLNKHYACAVIDEAQMINDRDRGGSWTEAILGIPADVVHVCMAPEAKTAVIKLIELCGDEYEIVEHERRVPLERENTAFIFPSSVQKHDALIVFSRKSVHAVASALTHKGIKCSIIYGSLPYDVRHEEARKFSEGETDVVVATDAIGMGLNLPIKRVAFLEQSKFDGVQSRPLNSTEVKQIAGRAGRYGVFDQGFYTAEFDLKGLRKKYNAEMVPINTISVSFPEALIGIDGPLSTIIEQWNEIKLQPGFVKESTDDLLALTKEIENQTDDKMLIYDLASIPVDLKNEDQHDLWLTIAKRVIKNKSLKILDELRAVENEGEVADDLFGLEQASKKCDILFNFDRKFLNSENNQKISETRSKISKKIMNLLGEKKLEPKRCKYCGKILPWNYPYGMCNECHDEMYPRRNSYHYNWDDEFDNDFDEDYM